MGLAHCAYMPIIPYVRTRQPRRQVLPHLLSMVSVQYLTPQSPAHIPYVPQVTFAELAYLTSSTRS